MEVDNQKPLSKYTNKEWRGLSILLTFFGIFVFFIGLNDKNLSTIRLGLLFIGIGLAMGFVLHFFFGIKIIQIRKDFKYKDPKK